MVHCYKNLLRAVAYTLVFTLSMELFARLEDRYRWNAPILAPYSLEGISLLGRGAPRNRPHASYRTFRINNHGFRGDDFSMAKPPGIVRVAVVGASETFGLYESPGQEFPAQLQRLLDDRRPGRFQVINAAAVGMTPPRVRELFHQWLMRFDIDVLVYYPTPVFYMDHLPPREADLSPVLRPPSPPSEHWTDPRLPARVWTMLKQRLPEHLQTQMKEFVLVRQRRSLDHEPWRAAPPERVDLFRRHMRELVEDVLDAGVQILLATHANRFRPDWPEHDRAMMVAWERFYPDAAGEGLLDMEMKGNSSLRHLAREMGVPLADVDRAVQKSPSRFADFSHFTDIGAREAAQTLATGLLSLEQAATAHE